MPNGDKLDVAGFASSYEAGTIIEPHAHPAHQIAHSVSGTLRVTAKGLLWFVPPGRALWIPACVSHAIQCSGRVEMRTVYLSKAYPTAHADVRVISVSPLMREVLVRLAECHSATSRLLLAEVLVNEVRDSALEALNIPVPRDARIATLASHMQNAPDDQTPLVTWAKRLGVSERTLIRSIRAETGMTFRELRRLTRIMVALDRLANGQSVTATALDVGFETPSAFIHAFRAMTGKTPRHFMSAS